MPPIDPFAPATHPRHPSQAGGRTAGVLRQRQRDVDAYEELAATHLTPAEVELREGTQDDGPVLPSLDELRDRVDALVDYLQRRDSDDNEPPRITDVFGVEHILSVSVDGDRAGWEPAARSYDDMTNAELKALLSDRDLPVSGKHDELVARLTEADAASAQTEQEQVEAVEEHAE